MSKQPHEQLLAEYRLVEAAQRNPRQFGVLYERYYQPIFLFVFKRVRDEEITADLVSQLFLKAMTNLHSYQFRGLPFSAWLYRIALNEVNQYFRDSSKERHVSAQLPDLEQLREEAEEPQAEDAIPCLVAAMQQLDPAELEFLELRYFEKMPFRELAALYGISENNAKVRMHRLLKKLKHHIDLSRQQTSL